MPRADAKLYISNALQLHLDYLTLEREVGLCRPCAEDECEKHSEQKVALDKERATMLRNIGAYNNSVHRPDLDKIRNKK